VAPDVGGGFGVKSMVYPEELAVAVLALKLGRPVRWTDTRQEHLLTTIQARGQSHDIALALRSDGTILALRDHFLVDGGASNVEALVSPYNTAAHLQGPYRIPHAEIDCRVALTTKAPMSAYRGAGRPEAVFALERIIDQAARALAIDRAELRRRNTLGVDELPYAAGIPYRDGSPMIVDGGDFLGCLDLALEAIGYDAQPGGGPIAGPEHPRILRGIGFAAYIEGTGIGPAEVADVAVDPSGEVVVAVGLPSQGQGHETTLAQICADQLGVSLDRVRVVQGDTGRVPVASGTIASRTAVVVGNAVADASRRVRRQAVDAAASLLEAAPADIDVTAGSVHVVGSPARQVDLGTIARALGEDAVAGSDGPTSLRAWGSFDPGSVTFANGVHAVEVEVDLDTGLVKIVRYVVVHDCGRVINPTILEGQICGGVAQGIGAALLEEVVYDDEGQLVTATLGDYLLPIAADIPTIEVHHVETPSTRNPLGIKGAGEAGTIPAQAAIAGAVEHALGDVVIVTTCPLTPARVWKLAQAARGREGDRDH
jgi:carbon-monoxide dehydrogenase large subunit